MPLFSSIRFKVTSLLVGVFATLAAAQYAINQRVVIPSFEEIENQAALTDMDRVFNAIDSEMEQLSIIGSDWGNWSKTWDFYGNRNAEYLTDNLTVQQLQAVHINVLAFLDLDGQFIAAKAIALQSSTDLDLDFIEHKSLPAGHLWRAALRAGIAVRGLISTNHGVMLTVLAPVLDGKGDGPHRGMVVMGRLLTAEAVSRIGEQAQVRVSLESLRKLAQRAPASAARENARFTTVTRDIRDITGAHADTLWIEVPRKISAQGLKTARSSELFLAFTCVAALLLLAGVLQHVILEPLARVQRFAVAISTTGDLTARMNLARGDEIGVLAKEMDRMVQSLDEAQRKLLDLSFSAGSTEMASGVLHNIGNALTPVAVAVVNLQQKLGAVPSGDLQLVLDELEAGASPGIRQDDLQKFLFLSSRELANAVVRAGDDISIVSHQIQEIRNILAHQSTLARSGPVMETVRISDMVVAAAAILPLPLRALLVIEMDESVRRLGAVRLERILLQQVFQNLLLNAAESVRDAGRGANAMRICCNVLRGEQGEQLEICFADSGVGVPAADLSRIFEKGYSTKVRHNNSGIGLHWCANTLGALGGRLSAESPGTGEGASFRVLLPLRRPADASVPEAA